MDQLRNKKIDIFIFFNIGYFFFFNINQIEPNKLVLIGRFGLVQIS